VVQAPTQLAASAPRPPSRGTLPLLPSEDPPPSEDPALLHAEIAALRQE
jgi:hypothetical protein